MSWTSVNFAAPNPNAPLIKAKPPPIVEATATAPNTPTPKGANTPVETNATPIPTPITKPAAANNPVKNSFGCLFIFYQLCFLL